MLINYRFQSFWVRVRKGAIVHRSRRPRQEIEGNQPASRLNGRCWREADLGQGTMSIKCHQRARHPHACVLAAPRRFRDEGCGRQRLRYRLNRRLVARAGFPATIAEADTSLVTIAPAATTAPVPTLRPSSQFGVMCVWPNWLPANSVAQEEGHRRTTPVRCCKIGCDARRTGLLRRDFHRGERLPPFLDLVLQKCPKARRRRLLLGSGACGQSR